MLDARILGQILLMQSMLNNLPTTQSIFSFVCRGLADVPGLGAVEYLGEHTLSTPDDCICMQVKRGRNFYGILKFQVTDRLAFEPYLDFLRNFVFMIEVVLEERYQNHLNKQHQHLLEKRVEERTKQLQTEIEEKGKISEALAISENLFRSAFQNSTQGICLVDSTGQFMQVNSTLCELFGYTKEELMHMDFNSITYHLDKHKGIEVIENLSKGQGEVAQFEKRYLHKDGRIIQAEVSTSIFRNTSRADNSTFFITHIQDITEEKDMQKALLQSELKYRTLFENMTTGFALNELVTDETGKPVDFRFLEVNPAFEKITGKDYSHVVGNLARKVIPTIVPLLLDRFVLVAQSGEPLSFQEHIKELNRYFDIWCFSPERNKFAIVFSDITIRINYQKQLKKNELRLKEQNEEYESLNEELRQSNEELVLAKQKAEESDRLKSAFLANMSHEIRTPMNGVIGFSELISLEDTPKEKRQYYCEIIKNSSEQLLSIVNDILDISKIETGQIDIYESSTDINLILLNLSNFFEQQAQKKGVQIILDTQLKDNNAIVLTDEAKLQQILTNLISNALKFTHVGSVTIGYDMRNSMLEFYVKDTGIGISPIESSIIFDRFQQAKQTKSTLYGGTGLGLAIAKAFIEKLSGRIWLESELGVGTTFFFTLPYRPV